MARNKHHFHCEKCKAECIIYKKGRGHRVLVCPNCGVLATNGLKLSGLAGTAYNLAKNFAPYGNIAGTALEALGLVDNSGSPSPSGTSQALGRVPQSPARLTSFEKALMLEKLERPVHHTQHRGAPYGY